MFIRLSDSILINTDQIISISLDAIRGFCNITTSEGCTFAPFVREDREYNLKKFKELNLLLGAKDVSRAITK